MWYQDNAYSNHTAKLYHKKKTAKSMITPINNQKRVKKRVKDWYNRTESNKTNNERKVGFDLKKRRLQRESRKIAEQIITKLL